MPSASGGGFGKLVADDDRRVFDQCVDTIVRQVGDIGRMVDEFSQFARMPKPSFEERDLSECVREAVFLLGVGHPEITFEAHLPETPLKGRFDHRLISQAVANLVKNAVEAIEGLPEDDRKGARVDVYGREAGDFNIVEVVDTGIGPADNRTAPVARALHDDAREGAPGWDWPSCARSSRSTAAASTFWMRRPWPDGGHGAMVRISLRRSIRTERAECRWFTTDRASDRVTFMLLPKRPGLRAAARRRNGYAGNNGDRHSDR